MKQCFNVYIFLNQIQEVHCTTIRNQIVNLRLNTSGALQKQLIGIMYHISQSGLECSNMIVEMADKLKSGDIYEVNYILQASHFILKRYTENTQNSDAITFVLDRLAQPLLDQTLIMLSLINTHKNSKQTLSILYSSFTLVVKITIRLNKQYVPSFFGINTDTWMEIFHVLIGCEIPNSPLLRDVHTEVCHNLQLYAEMYSVDFFLYSQVFVGDICQLLVKTDNGVKHDLVKKKYRMMEKIIF